MVLMMRTVCRLWPGVLMVSCAAAVAAQSGTASLSQMLDCRGVAGNQERLRCYDAAAGRVAQARGSGELVALDRGQLEAAKRQRFGLAAPRSEPVGDPLSGVQQITLKIMRVIPSGYGRYRMALSDAAIWETAEPLSSPPPEGAELTIRRAAFGGFRGSYGKNRSFLVKRLR